MKKELDRKIHKEIAGLCKEGDLLVKAGEYSKAAGKYVDALEMLPKPFTDWDAATWIFGSLGDAHFKDGAYEKALKSFANALYCPGGLGNAYIHLGLGKSQYELGQIEEATDNLTRAYMGGGKEVFRESDAKYFTFLNTKIKI